MFLHCVSLVFTSFAFLSIKTYIKKKKLIGALVSMFPCIGDNACFYCGGGRTLVEPNYALVTCLSYGKNFRIMALLGIILDLECI